MERYLKPLQKETFLTQDEVWRAVLVCGGHAAVDLLVKDGALTPTTLGAFSRGRSHIACEVLG